ncbi:MAG: hypothetical protein ABI818_06460 [Acidobacteriota bacterium]
MSDFAVRSDNVDVEQIMRQIRSRIREKRGVDYTEEEIRELANVKLEKFLDPRGVRSDLLEQFRRKREASLPPNFTFEDTTLFETHRGFLRFMRRLLRPILKLFFNPNPLIEALHIQSKLNAQQAALEPLYYEVIHNLVLETTRSGIEVKNLKMRVESMSSRLDFDERRARALEGVVQYRPGAVPPLQPPRAGAPGGAGAAAEVSPVSEAEQAERRNRRRRRRGRRRPGEGREGSAPGSSEESPNQGHLEAGADQAALAPQHETSDRPAGGDPRFGLAGANDQAGDAPTTHGSAPGGHRDSVDAGSDEPAPPPPVAPFGGGGGSHES